MLIVEDGTIVANANAYISLLDADLYHDARGNDRWKEASIANREAAIIKATDYLDFAYDWEGVRSSATQSLEWPRAGVVSADHMIVPGDSIPAAIERACAELALRALDGDLMGDESRGGAVTEETVGPITVKYEQGAIAGTVYRSIDKIVAGLYFGRGFWKRTERI